jgi:hypothetical protein
VALTCTPGTGSPRGRSAQTAASRSNPPQDYFSTDAEPIRREPSFGSCLRYVKTPS